MASAHITDAEIDAVAKFLRETTQSGKNLTPWGATPRSAKTKWITLAEGALLAAASARKGGGRG